ncbi:hypothetical protein HQ520_08965, partial [bacterium]|nr:hypothetical protein [bacterium]
GYVPKPDAFEPSGGGYETVLTSYSNLDIQAGPKIVEASLDLARKFKPGRVLRRARTKLEGPVRAWNYGVLGPDLE